MEFELSRDSLLKPLHQVIGVVEKKLQNPILSFVLLNFNHDCLTISATDLDIQLSSKVNIPVQVNSNQIVLPARKLLDICRLLPEHSIVKLKLNNEKNQVILSSNNSKFTLLSLNYKNFPFKQQQLSGISVKLPQSKLRALLNATSFAIAQLDVRNYLKGLLWEVNPDKFVVVASDGHRLARAVFKDFFNITSVTKILVPRKSVFELFKLLKDEDEEILIDICDKSLQITTNDFIFSTKLIEAQFPNYQNIFDSAKNSYPLELNKELLKQILNRVAILSNEKHRAVRLCFNNNQLLIAANNPEHEQAEEFMEIFYKHTSIEICFNVGYLIDVLNKINSNNINLLLSQATNPILITPNSIEEVDSDYIIMPMFL